MAVFQRCPSLPYYCNKKWSYPTIYRGDLDSYLVFFDIIKLVCISASISKNPGGKYRGRTPSQTYDRKCCHFGYVRVTRISTPGNFFKAAVNIFYPVAVPSLFLFFKTDKNIKIILIFCLSTVGRIAVNYLEPLQKYVHPSMVIIILRTTIFWGTFFIWHSGGRCRRPWFGVGRLADDGWYNLFVCELLSQKTWKTIRPLVKY